MKPTRKPLARKKDIVVQESNGETLVYDLHTNKALCLNETSALVWQLCNGKNTVSEIGVEIGGNLKTLVSEDLVWLTLDLLKKDGLLENGESIGVHFVGLSRREVIRKVGFASVVALPIVSSIVAPEAIAAQSGTCDAAGCTTALGGIGPCISPNTEFCPAACSACTITIEQHFASTDTSCPFNSANTSFTCSGPTSFTYDTRLTSVT